LYIITAIQQQIENLEFLIFDSGRCALIISINR